MENYALSTDVRRYVFDVVAYTVVTFYVGPPEKPRNLTYSDLTSNSVTLHWISGYDMGSAQRFFIFNKGVSDLVRKTKH